MSPSFGSKLALDHDSVRNSNADMDPIPMDKRTWSTWSYVGYWVSDSANVVSWELASSMLAVGLSWRQALIAISIGHIIISLVMVLNGTIGARLGIAFSVLIRSSFGYWFSYFPVLSRAILGMFWFAVQTFTGSQCVYQMLKAIWPSTARIPNHLGENATITTSGIMCYFLFWLIQFPFMFVSPQKIRYLFVVKGIIVPATFLAMLIWATVKVPVADALAAKHSAIKGPSLSWALLAGMNSALGNFSTLAVNIPDFTRYAKRPRDQYIQLLIIPVAFTLTGFIGIAVTSAGETLYGDTYWNALLLIDQWNNRAAAFFASFSFALATLGTNISANSLSAANDLTVLFPKYINIRRGQIITAFVAWILCPWEILATAPGFLSFMGGYVVFLGPFAGIMASDYWLVRRGRVDVPALYFPHGRYRYVGGVNWRAVVAMLFSAVPLLPGLINSINTKIYVGGATYLFNVGWIYGFVSASFVYWLLSTIAPAKETIVTDVVLEDGKEKDSEETASEKGSKEQEKSES
ncbi:cytosine-purine permease [Flagelloscypha sp. PMI_526]|nr:cytosine-purine permease [Flagelloscypha sp. PMI_526]